jgi:hypothetical protein
MLGAVASSAPNLEHVLPLLRPRGRKLFHDRLGWHRSGRFPAALQVLLAGAILGALSVSRRRDGPAAEDLLSATGWRTNRLNDRGASEENDEQSRLERRLLVLMRHNLRQLRKHVDWHRERLQ